MEEMLKQILGELQGIKSEVKNTNDRLEKMDARLHIIESDIQDLKKGQEEIKDIIRDNEGKQGKNHLELIEEIKNIKEEVNFVETISIKNLSDIHKLKVIK